MKTYAISIQHGLTDIEHRLREEGHQIVPYDQAGLNADIVIISGVDSAYEEIETAQCRLGQSGRELLLINASGLHPDTVVSYIEKNVCNCC